MSRSETRTAVIAPAGLEQVAFLVVVVDTVEHSEKRISVLSSAYVHLLSFCKVEVIHVLGDKVGTFRGQIEVVSCLVVDTGGDPDMVAGEGVVVVGVCVGCLVFVFVAVLVQLVGKVCPPFHYTWNLGIRNLYGPVDGLVLRLAV